MTFQVAEQRKYSRIATALHVVPDGAPALLLVINVSQGGACLWLNDPPQDLQDMALRFRCDGRDHVVKSRVVWSRFHAAVSNHENQPDSKSWFAGVAFAGATSDIKFIDISQDILRADHATVSFSGCNDAWFEPVRDRNGEDDSVGVMALNEASIPAIKAATGELVPVFAKHFSDIRLVFTQQHLEISASFRAPVQSTAPQIEHRDRQPRQTRKAPSIAAPSSAEQPAGVAPAANLSNALWSRRLFMVVLGIAIVILGAIFSGALRKSDETSTASGPELARQSSPVWAQQLRLNEAALDGWLAIQKTFNLSDQTIQSAILTLRNNDKYPSAHDLHDLANHPVQVGRAFSLLAAAHNKAGTTDNIGALKDDLQSRFMAGARFPDETPGNRYSSLQRELYDNLVVLGVVDLLQRRQEDAGAKEIITAIQRSQSTDQPESGIRN